MAAAQFANAPVQNTNVVWGAPEREQLKKNTVTGTFPYLETPEGNLAETYAIIQYFAANFNEKLLGTNSAEQSQVNQWVQFAQQEITRYNKDLIYPLLGFTEHNAAAASNAHKQVVQWVKVLDAHMAGKSFIVGNEITLADLENFYPLRLYFQFVFTEAIRQSIPNVTAWFTKLMVHPILLKCYGRTLLCKVAQTAPVLPKLVNIKKNIQNFNKLIKKLTKFNKINKLTITLTETRRTQIQCYCPKSHGRRKIRQRSNCFRKR